MTPDGWRSTVLGEDAILLSGQHILAEECSESPVGPPYLTGPADFQGGVIRATKYVKTPKVLCEPGDILVTIKGSGTGKLVEADDTYCISRQLAAVRPRSWWRRFVFHVLSSYQDRLQGSASGLIPGLSRDDLLGLPVLVPSLGEQKKIASVLSSVDEAIEATQAVIDQLGVVKEAMMAELLTRGLPGRHTRFRQTEIGELPEDWEVVPLREACEFLDGRRVPIKAAERRTGPYPYYGASGIIDWVDGFIFDELLILLAEDGANILTRSSPIAFKVTGKCWVNNHAHVLRPRPGMDPDFLINYLESLDYEQFSTGTAQPKLNQAVCQTIPTVRPPYEEQERIGTVFRLLEKRLEAEKAQLTHLKSLKTALVSVLLTGEVRVPPDEEAA